jgi:hypothetical protein
VEERIHLKCKRLTQRQEACYGAILVSLSRHK